MSRLILTDANVVDGELSRSGASVVIEGERITAVLDASPPVEPGDDLVALEGRTVMPGMYTCHFHPMHKYSGVVGSPGNQQPPARYAPAYEALICAHNFRIALAAGYTGVVGAGGGNDVEAGVKEALQDGFILGPRVWASGRLLSTTGNANDYLPWYWNVSHRGGLLLCDGADSFRLGVRQEVKRGVEVIKLFVTGGHGVRAPKTRMEMTEEELKAAIDAGHARGVLVRGHIVNKRAILMAIELGIDIIDHCDDMDDEVIAALAESGTFVVPSIVFGKMSSANLETSDPDTAAAIRRNLEFMYEALPKADAAGVKLLLGDDYGGTKDMQHGSYGNELHSLVEDVGLRPTTVLRWGTRHAAELVKRPDLGTVAPGATADLLVVDGDPTTDIGLLADKPPVAVMLGGEVLVGALPGRA